MTRILALVPLAAAVLLSACATSRPSMSYVAPEVTAADAQTLAADTVAYLSDPLPPARTTLVLDPPTHAKHDALTVAMLNALRARGYGVSIVDPKTGVPAGQGTPLRYLASPLYSGMVLRLQFQGVEASRFYPRTASGKLVPADADFMVRGSK
ncbi:conjugal transfer protein TrbH [Pseudomonas coleopterorum]|uniref:conjugal transfer protein TrbH n=1 Tax=Pseudomonas coleopterorum TaxID=1605838 RepID=UPI0017812E70|nr:conjugal transfer protein TrbH [Pseudomonas coleopterorum]MBD8483925.1 conjugal transfer protein TrbH [Pseudomonas coleopterorum]